MLVNLTPHPLRFYPLDCPDRIEEGAVEPLFAVAPSGTVARIEEATLGTWFSDCFDHQVSAESCTTVAVEGVEYGHISGLPEGDVEAFNLNLTPRTYYVVPLVVALAAPGRPDLLVVYRDVRSMTGTVLGCRQLARPC